MNEIMTQIILVLVGVLIGWAIRGIVENNYKKVKKIPQKKTKALLD